MHGRLPTARKRSAQPVQFALFRIARCPVRLQRLPADDAAPSLKSTSPAVVRAVHVMDAVAAAPEPLTLADLTRLTGAPKVPSTACATPFVQLQLLKRLPNGAMAVGPHVMAWANAFLSQTQMTSEFRALWEQTDAFHDATVTLSMLDGAEGGLPGLPGTATARSASFRIGMRLPAPYTATGKAMLSTLLPAEVRDLFAPGMPPPLTRASVADVEGLQAELAQVPGGGIFDRQRPDARWHDVLRRPGVRCSRPMRGGRRRGQLSDQRDRCGHRRRIGQQVRALADQLSAEARRPAAAPLPGEPSRGQAMLDREHQPPARGWPDSASLRMFCTWMP